MVILTGSPQEARLAALGLWLLAAVGGGLSFSSIFYRRLFFIIYRFIMLSFRPLVIGGRFAASLSSG